MNRKTVAIIGAGRVGSSVGFLLKRAGYTVTAIASLTESSAKMAAAFVGAGKPATDVVGAAAGAELVFITTPDRVIKEVCEKIGAAGAGSLAEKPELTGTIVILVAIPETMVILGFVVATMILFTVK